MGGRKERLAPGTKEEFHSPQFDRYLFYTYNISVYISWDEAKNEWLKANRHICFEQIVEIIGTGNFLGPENNPARAGQYRIIARINGYPYAVPLVIDDEGNWLLKTAYPDRKLKRREWQ